MFFFDTMPASSTEKGFKMCSVTVLPFCLKASAIGSVLFICFHAYSDIVGIVLFESLESE